MSSIYPLALKANSFICLQMNFVFLGFPPGIWVLSCFYSGWSNRAIREGVCSNTEHLIATNICTVETKFKYNNTCNSWDKTFKWGYPMDIIHDTCLKHNWQPFKWLQKFCDYNEDVSAVPLQRIGVFVRHVFLIHSKFSVTHMTRVGQNTSEHFLESPMSMATSSVPVLLVAASHKGEGSLGNAQRNSSFVWSQVQL